MLAARRVEDVDDVDSTYLSNDHGDTGARIRCGELIADRKRRSLHRSSRLSVRRRRHRPADQQQDAQQATRQGPAEHSHHRSPLSPRNDGWYYGGHRTILAPLCWSAPVKDSMVAWGTAAREPTGVPEHWETRDPPSGLQCRLFLDCCGLSGLRSQPLTAPSTTGRADGSAFARQRQEPILSARFT